MKSLTFINECSDNLYYDENVLHSIQQKLNSLIKGTDLWSELQTYFDLPIIHSKVINYYRECYLQ